MKSRKLSRRRFLQTSSAATALAAAGIVPGAGNLALAADDNHSSPAAGSARNVALVCDPADAVAATAPAQWALGLLEATLKSKGVAVRHCAKIGQAQPNEYCIVAAGTKSPALEKLIGSAGAKIPTGPETVALASAGVDDRPTLFACGSDARGLMYALLEVADRVTHADPPLAALETQKPIIEQPANAIRAIGRLFVSDVEDLPWYRDKKFWQDYLTMLATERFNRFNLTLGLGYDFANNIRDSYFYFAYPFFLAVPGYNVRAVNLPDTERDENLALLNFIGQQCAQRGIHFQLGLWCHAYHWNNSAKANYTIEGLSPDNHANYCRDALTALLKACPSVTGVTIRTHGESGVTEGSYDFWKTIFQGVPKCGRQVNIDLHPKGIDQQMIDNALATGMPVELSPKYWAEHTGLPYQPASIRATEKPKSSDEKGGGLFSLSNGARRFMRYSYGDLLQNERKYDVFFRMWPGSMKLLVWGDPEMAAAWGRYASFCGSKGMEIQEPLSFKGKQGTGKPGGRNAYADAALKPAADWEKFAYAYRLWGRLLYNPDTEPEVWRRMLRTRWQAAAPAAEQALAHSSRIIPLITTAHLPSAANANFWPEMYTSMSISDPSVASPYGDTPSPKRFGTVSPLDPELFCTIDEYVDELVTNKRSGKFSPSQVALWLMNFAQQAEANLKRLDSQNPEYGRLFQDVKIQIQVGRFFAHKIGAALLYALHQQTDDLRSLEKAVDTYRAARDQWAELAKLTDPVYVQDITFGQDRQLRGNWSDRLKAIDDDLDRLAKLRPEDWKSDFQVPTMHLSNHSAIRESLGAEQLQLPLIATHRPATSFKAGHEFPIVLKTENSKAGSSVESVKLHYRHVNQAEEYKTVEMKSDGTNWTAVIPAAYTNSPYSLQYFFRIVSKSDAWHYPDLGANLCNQPYFVLRPAV